MSRNYTFKRGDRIIGTQRERLAEMVAKDYEKGDSIRAIAETLGRSYGFVHRLLVETGSVVLRPRGGGRRKSR